MGYISIEDVSMQYALPKKYSDFLKPFAKGNSFCALRHVNTELQLGDRLAVLGPNGAGKTTFLKLIGGLLYPSKGTIHINGFETKSANLKARRDVGYVLNEERSFFWRLTGYQNLKFFGVLDNIGHDLSGRIEELLKLVEMEKHAHKRFYQYSSGMKQRLALARGLLSKPKVLILDEPTRTLDPVSAIEIKELLTNKICKSDDRILIIATHRLEEASSLCNNVCIIHNGMLKDLITMDDLLLRYKSLDEYYFTTIKSSHEKKN